MNVLEKILEEISEVEKEYVTGHKVLYTLGATGMAIEISRIIHSHMDEAKDINVPSNVGWIPVEERLPEDERMVLVTYMTKSGIPSVDRARFDGKYWRGSGFMGRVIAWRPIPEPYKSKKDLPVAGNEHIMSRFMKVE